MNDALAIGAFRIRSYWVEALRGSIVRIDDGENPINSTTKSQNYITVFVSIDDQNSLIGALKWMLHEDNPSTYLEKMVNHQSNTLFSIKKHLSDYELCLSSGVAHRWYCLCRVTRCELDTFIANIEYRVNENMKNSNLSL